MFADPDCDAPVAEGLSRESLLSAWVTALLAKPGQEGLLVGGTFVRLPDGEAEAKRLAAALRNAQLRFLRQEMGAAHPGLWAGFTLTGEWR